MPVSETILPVLIGADMNCYTLARAFHEAYGVRSYAFGRWAMGDTMYSRLVRFTAVPDIDSADTLLRTVTDFAAAHANKTLIVMGCTDDYASLLMDVRDKLPRTASRLTSRRSCGTSWFPRRIFTLCATSTASPTPKPSAPKAPWTPPPCRPKRWASRTL